MEIRRISHEMLDSVITNFNVQVSRVIQHSGACVEHCDKKLHSILFNYKIQNVHLFAPPCIIAKRFGFSKTFL